MNIQIQVIVDGDESTRRDIAHIERGALSGDSLGLQLSEAKQLPDRTLPERLYLESKWASLLSYGLTTRLLEDTLPFEGKIHINSVRNHAYRAARRLENELTVDPMSHRIEAAQWPQNNIPPPKPRITVGLDGGYIRARDAPSPREGWFEAITGRSTVEAGTSKCFAFVQRIDRHAEPRMCRLFKDQGMVYHQPVTFVSDGGRAPSGGNSRARSTSSTTISIRIEI